MSFKDEVGELSERGSLRLVSCPGLYLALRAEQLEAKLFQGRVEVLFRRLARRDLLVSELFLPIPAPSVPAASKQASEEAAPFAYVLIIRAAAPRAQRRRGPRPASERWRESKLSTAASPSQPLLSYHWS